MAVLNFPSSPALNQVYSANGYSWKWNGASWISLPTINGGTINGTTIGSTTPASGAFTTLTTTGNAGIGTTSPAARLDVVGADSAVCYTYLRSYSSTAWQAPRIGTYRYRGTQASPTAVATGDELFSLEVSGRNVNGTDTYAGGLGWYATGTVSGNNIPSYFTISTNATNGAVERVRVDSTGLSVTGAISASSDIAAQSGAVLVGSGGYQMLLRTISGTNRLDSYNNPITATAPLQLNASQMTFQIADSTKMSLTSTGINGTAIGATTPSTSVFTSTEWVDGNRRVKIFPTNDGTTQLVCWNNPITTYTPLRLNASAVTIAINDTDKFVFSSTGLAVTGTLSATGNVGLAAGTLLTLNGNNTAASYAIQAATSASPYDFRFIGDSDSVTQRNFSFGYYTSNNSGNTWNPKVIINSYTGMLRFYAYGAGTLVTDANGSVTASSDGRMKDVLGTFDRGLAAICGITPQLFKWNAESGLDTEAVNAGFIAQDVLPHIPEAIHEKDGRYSMSDRPLIAALVNAVKELSERVAALEGAAKA